LDSRAANIRVLDPQSPMPDNQRAYLASLGVKTVLIIPLTARGQANGRLTFRFTEEHDFHPEELEIARALATQASLAIHLTRLAKSARQSAVLAERNSRRDPRFRPVLLESRCRSVWRGEVIATGGGSILKYPNAHPTSHTRAEARRSAFSLQPTLIEESGLIEVLQKLAERSNIPGRLRCDFHSEGFLEESLPPAVQQDLLRIAQEAISNAVRHARPAIISVHLNCNLREIVLEVTDDGSGIADSLAASTEGFGFSNMRARAEKIGAQLEVRTAASRGTTVAVHVPTNFC
jgi:nitrate/nitrite-specific signal transduction histidine kinase